MRYHLKIISKSSSDDFVSLSVHEFVFVQETQKVSRARKSSRELIINIIYYQFKHDSQQEESHTDQIAPRNVQRTPGSSQSDAALYRRKL